MHIRRLVKAMSPRTVVRVLLAAGCLMLFTLVVLKDARLYLESQLWENAESISNYAVIKGNYMLVSNQSLIVEQLPPDRNRISQREETSLTNVVQDSFVNTIQKLEQDRYRLAARKPLLGVPDTSHLSSKPYCGQKPRQVLMRKACAWLREYDPIFTREDDLKNNFTFRLIFVDDVRKLLYCEVPKVACTSWKYLFANLSGKVDPKDYSRLHELIHDTKYYPKVGFKYLSEYTFEERQYRLQNYYKFLVTRNPYSRLISAFENKLFPDTPQSKWYHENVGRYIIKKHRTNASDVSLQKGNDMRFEELVKFIADPNENHQHRYDAHWWHVNNLCHPCIIHYDYIAKMETLQDDIPHILHRISPDTNLTLPLLNTKRRASSHNDDIMKIQSFLRDISVTDLLRLEKIYNVDLKTFGYSVSQNNLECQYDDTP